MENGESVSRHEGIPQQRSERWDIGAISQALKHAPESTPAQDIAHGPGVRYDLAEGTLTVELFPPHAERSTGIVRLSTADSRQEFYRQPHPAIRDEGLIFETHEHLISLSPTGQLRTARRVPEEGAQLPSDAAERDERESDTPDEDRGAESDSGTPGRAFQNALPETEGQPRVSYSGRLGTDPRCRTTPKEILVCSFPVAEKQGGSEKPIWRTTVAFRELAGKVQETLKKGMFVDVVGYEHVKPRKTRDGTVRQETEVYAVAIRPR